MLAKPLELRTVFVDLTDSLFRIPLRIWKYPVNYCQLVPAAPFYVVGLAWLPGRSGFQSPFVCNECQPPAHDLYQRSSPRGLSSLFARPMDIWRAPILERPAVRFSLQREPQECPISSRRPRSFLLIFLSVIAPWSVLEIDGKHCALEFLNYGFSSCPT
jgi:hypothetical protein